MTSRFNALSSQYDDSDEEAEESLPKTAIPTFEDLSLCRTDEETVLEAVYGKDFRKGPGEAWGSHVYCIRARPQHLRDEEIGCGVS